MTEPDAESEKITFILVQAGPSYRLGMRFGLVHEHPTRRGLKILLVICVTWLPLLVLSVLSGRACSGVQVPFLDDPEVAARFLIVMPLLEFAQVIVTASLAIQVNQFLEVGLIDVPDRLRFLSIRSRVLAVRESPVAEWILLIIAYLMSLGLRVGLGLSAGDSSWERISGTVTPAGWWFALISLPILYFFLLRWIWVLVLWGWFLWQVAGIRLRLTATHPDHAGGLGFIGRGVASFSLVLMAFSTVFSAGMADEILHHGQSLSSLKNHAIVFAIICLTIAHLPQLSFAGQLSRSRFRGLLEFGALAWRHDRAFDEKWLEHPQAAMRDDLLGSADIQSLSDVATCYEHVEEMRPIPIDLRSSAILVLAILLPMCPLLATEIPLTEILMKLGEVFI